MAAVVGRLGGRRKAEKETQGREGGERVIARLQGLQKGCLPARLREILLGWVSREKWGTAPVGRGLRAVVGTQATALGSPP